MPARIGRCAGAGRCAVAAARRRPASRGRGRIPPATIRRLADQPGHQRRPDLGGHRPGSILGPAVEHGAGVGRVIEGGGQRRLSVACRLAGPALPPRDGGGRRDLAVGPGQPGQGPGPGHHPVRVVAATTGRQPASGREPMGEAIHQSRGRAMGRGRDGQVGQRIPGVRIGPVLADHDIRPERGGQFGEQRGQGLQPGPLPGPGRQRHVDRGPGGGPLPDLVDEAGAREQRPAALVDAEGQDPGIRPVQRLDPVAVVDVEVDVQDAQPGLPGPGDGQRRVVVDAEARGPPGHRVMQAAARVLGVLHVAAQDRLHGRDRAARDGGRRLVHARERRVVAAVADAPFRRPERPLRRSAGRPRGSGRRGTTRAGRRVAGSGASPGTAPTARSRSMPGPKRRGVSGWPGPKS